MLANSGVTLHTDNSSPNFGAVFIFTLIDRCHLKPFVDFGLSGWDVGKIVFYCTASAPRRVILS
jgi:hypothetical protein